MSPSKCLLAGVLALVIPSSTRAKEANVASKTATLDWPEQTQWTTRFRGVEYQEIKLTQPRPLAVHALRIDLTAPGVQAVTDFDNGDRPEETDGLKTSTFLTRYDCQVAINGAPFWPGVKNEGQPQNVAGFVVADGKLVSPFDDAKPRAALVLRHDGTASIKEPPVALADVVVAVGGYGVVLRDGQVVRPDRELAEFIDTLHPRTAVGVADDGRTLLMVVVDGRQPGYSEGVSLGELGEILQRLGASDGLNLDGGGTSTMVASDSAGDFELLNQPIEGGVPGNERVSASHLGIRAHSTSE